MAPRPARRSGVCWEQQLADGCRCNMLQPPSATTCILRPAAAASRQSVLAATSGLCVADIVILYGESSPDHLEYSLVILGKV